jgi:hypothetical protein
MKSMKNNYNLLLMKMMICHFDEKQQGTIESNFL